MSKILIFLLNYCMFVLWLTLLNLLGCDVFMRPKLIENKKMNGLSRDKNVSYLIRVLRDYVAIMGLGPTNRPLRRLAKPYISMENGDIIFGNGLG